MIELRTLGTVRVLADDGRPLDEITARPKRLALLVYLAASQPAGPRQRDVLTALFWPDTQQERARTALRQALHVLRGMLGDDVLRTTGVDAVRVETTRLRCDAADFAFAVRGCRHAEALRLYQGPFLPGFYVPDAEGFEGWTADTRARLHEEAVRSARALCEEARASEDWVNAVRWAEQALQLSPVDEGAMLQLLSALEGQGNRSQALAAYRAFADRFRHDIGAEPSAELRRLAAQLQGPAPARAVSAPVVGETSALSVAVLPFSNLSGDPDFEYFCDGLTEELIADLSALPGLAVPARTSSFAFRGRALDVRQVAERLRVRYLVEGSVRRMSERLRVTVSLVEAHTGYRAWAHHFDTTLQEAARQPGKLSADVASGLSRRLNVRFDGRPARATEEPEAHLLYLRGMHHFMKKSPADMRRAVTLFEEAIRRDPEYAVPHAGLAHAWVSLPVYAGAAPDDCYPQAMQAARRCMALDPRVAGAHGALGLALIMYQWNWSEGLPLLRHAVTLDPWDPNLHAALAMYGLTPTGQHQEARAHAERAAALDPLSLPMSAYRSWVAYMARDYARAAAHARETLELGEHFSLGHWFLGRTLEKLGRLQEALLHSERAAELTGASPVMRAQVAYVLARMGHRQQAQGVLAEAEAAAGGAVGFFTSAAHAALGDVASGLRCLRDAVASRSSFLTGLAVSPLHDDFRGQPGFADVLQAVGLQDVGGSGTAQARPAAGPPKRAS